MKKSLITQFAMMMFVAFTLSFTLTSCGEEVVIDPPIKGKTVFAAGPVNIGGEDGTRTYLTKDRVYLWQFNDQIWVNDNGTWRKSQDSELSPDSKAANFYYDKVYTAPSYEVVYTGYNSTSATQVTIPSAFSVGSNIGTEIGIRGDCGVATAERQSDGTYKFSLLHKGSYLGVAPLKTSYLKRNFRWTKIEVTDVNGNPIAGTFDFSHADGINVNSVTSPSDMITLTVPTDINVPLQSYNSDYDYQYIVLPPSNRELKVKYYFYDTSAPTVTKTFTKKLNARDFIANNVVLFRHDIQCDYYCWDAPFTSPVDGIDNKYNNNTAAPWTPATNSCATMPNPNELAWYIKNGDPHWDNTTKWTVDDGASYHTGGVWIKKKANIAGFSSTVDHAGRDLCTPNSFSVVNNTTDSYRSSGKPADTSQYFFLPALGVFYSSEAAVRYSGTQGYYWSTHSTEDHSIYGQMAYCLFFDSNQIVLSIRARGNGYIAGNGSDWFK